MENKTKNLIKNIAISILSVALVAVISSLISNRTSDWYTLLNKPSQWPAPAVFPTMWTIIYVIAIGLVFYVLQKGYMTVPTAIIFAGNGLLNIIWCAVFFAGNSLIWGCIILLANLYAGIMLVIQMFKINKIVGHITTFYIFWLSIATVLNAITWALN